MKTFIPNFYIILTIALPVLGYSLNNYTCGVEGFCTESIIIELQHQGMVYEFSLRTNKERLYHFHFLYTLFLVTTNKECLEVCEGTDKCTWVSFDRKYMECFTYEDCKKIDVESCGTCISSQKECLAPTCDLTGYCEVWTYKYPLGLIRTP